MKHLTTILLIGLLASCTKEVSKPTIELRTPNRPEIITVQTIVDPITYARCCNIIGWQFRFNMATKAEADVKIWYNWKQKGEAHDWTFYADVRKGETFGGMATMIQVTGEIEYIRLVKVEGTDRKFNLLHVK